VFDNGDCSSGISGDGSCICDMGWWGANCEKCCDSTSQDLDSCDARYYGATADGIPTSCTQCPDCGNGNCLDGNTGSGDCTCTDGWADGADCGGEGLCNVCADDHYGVGCLLMTDCGEHGAGDEADCGTDGSSGCNCDCNASNCWDGVLCTYCKSEFYGATCTACSDCTGGGIGTGTCTDGIDNDGACVCSGGYALGDGGACTECAGGYYGADCLTCPTCGTHGDCDEGISGHCVQDVGIPSAVAP
jgi:hypothetical protein